MLTTFEFLSDATCDAPDPLVPIVNKDLHQAG